MAKKTFREARCEQARNKLQVREPISSEEFLNGCNLPQTSTAITVVEIARNYIGGAARTSALLLFPNDALDDPTFREALEWDEFGGVNIPYELERRLGVRIKPADAEKIIDPSSPTRRGKLSDFVRELVQLVENSAQRR